MSLNINITFPLVSVLRTISDGGELRYYTSEPLYRGGGPTPIGSTGFTRIIVSINEIYRTSMDLLALSFRIIGLSLGIPLWKFISELSVFRIGYFIGDSITVLTAAHLIIADNERRMIPKMILSASYLHLAFIAIAIPRLLSPPLTIGFQVVDLALRAYLWRAL